MNPKIRKACKLVLAIFTVMALAGASVSSAAPILDFGVYAPTTGSISYGGGGNPLVGTNISVDNLVGMDTLLNDGAQFNLLNGALNFTTGNLTESSAASWHFGGGAGSSITLTGTIDVNGNGSADYGDITGTLLSGGFGTAEVIYYGGKFNIAGAAFNDYKTPQLLDLYGLPKFLTNGEPLPYSGNFNISFFAAGTPPHGFASTKVLSGDIVNTPIPEPGTILLLGAGLIGFGIYGRSRLRG